MFASMKVTTADSVLSNNPGFFKTANSLLTAVPVDVWKAYLQWAVIKNSAGYLSSAFVNRQFQFSQVLSGQKQITPRWQRMSNLVDGRSWRVTWTIICMKNILLMLQNNACLHW